VGVSSSVRRNTTTTIENDVYINGGARDGT